MVSAVHWFAAVSSIISQVQGWQLGDSVILIASLGDITIVWCQMHSLLPASVKYMWANTSHIRSTVATGCLINMPAPSPFLYAVRR
jgi:hypothetical protein